MKKIIALMLAVCMVASLAMLTGCGENETNDATSLTGCGENETNDATSQDAQADSDLAYIKEKGSLIVGITDFAPMDYKEDGKWIGFDADMANAFAESLGVNCEFIEINWDSKEMELNNKSIDCVWNGMTLTDGVKAAMETSKPYCNNAQIIVVKKDIADAIKKVDDAKELTFAVESGSAGMEAAKANGLTFIEVGTQSNAVMEVAAGTSDACVIDSLMAAAMVGEGTSYPNLAYTISLQDEEYGVGFRKGSDMASKLDEFLKKAYDDGTTMKIAEKYDTQAAVIAQ